ncbi:hypothetical protein ACIA5G_33750 [Amycolatopsis sp. NPDC051758]|uniref:hypothetical protein n=1 Tax=Amycolatopsis sp. NPDC051758 TaxID=3363935 RepID=UPI0037A19825
MPERSLIDAAKLADLADRLAACLGPSMRAEDAPRPDSLTLAAWHAMNALHRVVELLQLPDEPDARFASLTDLAARGEGIVQATLDTLIAEGHGDPIVERAAGHGHPEAASKVDATALQLSFPGGQTVSLRMARHAGADNILQLAGPSHAVVENLDPATREAATATVAEIAHVLVSKLPESE